MRRFVPAFVISALLLLLASAECFACTGIALTATDGSRVVARTVEWAASPMQCGYVFVPRGFAAYARVLHPAGLQRVEGGGFPSDETSSSGRET